MDEKKTGNLSQKRNLLKEKKPIEEYLHCIDVDKVLLELGLDMNGLCDMLNLDYQTINRWSWTKSKKGNRPTYNAVIRMLQKGASTKTLFGVDAGNIQKPSATDETHLSQAIQELLKHPEFVSGMEKALADVEAKKKGSV